jgi:hypothetical protein
MLDSYEPTSVITIFAPDKIAVRERWAGAKVIGVLAVSGNIVASRKLSGGFYNAE